MTDSAIAERLLRAVDRLDTSDQERVLAFAEGLAETPPGTPLTNLLQFVGCISHEDLETMRLAIEEGCEQIDEDGW